YDSELRLPAFNAKNTSAAAPSTTNSPTHKSNDFRCINHYFLTIGKRGHAPASNLNSGSISKNTPFYATTICDRKRYQPQYHLLNINAVSRKSSHNTVSEAITTVRVVARATPSGVGRAS